MACIGATCRKSSQSRRGVLDVSTASGISQFLGGWQAWTESHQMPTPFDTTETVLMKISYEWWNGDHTLQPENYCPSRGKFTVFPWPYHKVNEYARLTIHYYTNSNIEKKWDNLMPEHLKNLYIMYEEYYDYCKIMLMIKHCHRCSEKLMV